MRLANALRILAGLLALLVMAGCGPQLSPPPPGQEVITPAIQAAQAATMTPRVPITCRVSAAAALNLRAGPGTGYQVLAWLRAGEILTRTTEAERGVWWEILTPAGARGWIHSSYCKGD